MPTFAASSCCVSPSMIRRSRSLAATRRSASSARGLPARVRAAGIEFTTIDRTLPTNAAPHKRGAQAGLQPTRSYKTWRGPRRLVAEDGRERKHGVSRQKVPKQPKAGLPAVRVLTSCPTLHEQERLPVAGPPAEVRRPTWHSELDPPDRRATLPGTPAGGPTAH